MEENNKRIEKVKKEEVKVELGSSEFLLKCEYGERRKTHSLKVNTSKIDSLSLSLCFSLRSGAV